ncbi:uncharacterized protein [Watersipora subatra]|uniref:uncharacterized protein n=1 Tax=Watersipora subatra TaxID=2589382 RepID=UPI00355ADA64
MGQESIFLALLILAVYSAAGLPLGSLSNKQLMSNRLADTTERPLTFWSKRFGSTDMLKNLAANDGDDLIADILRDMRTKEKMDESSSNTRTKIDSQFANVELKSVSDKRKYRCLVNIVNCYYG